MMTTGASLKPDSASSMPLTRRGSGTLRSTAKTAAASVEARIAPMSRAVFHGMCRTKWAARATTPMETSAPTVASAAAGASEPLIVSHFVVTPPSVRMRTRAA